MPRCVVEAEVDEISCLLNVNVKAKVSLELDEETLIAIFSCLPPNDEHRREKCFKQLQFAYQKVANQVFESRKINYFQNTRKTSETDLLPYTEILEHGYTIDDLESERFAEVLDDLADEASDILDMKLFPLLKIMGERVQLTCEIFRFLHQHEIRLRYNKTFLFHVCQLGGYESGIPEDYFFHFMGKTFQNLQERGKPEYIGTAWRKMQGRNDPDCMNRFMTCYKYFFTAQFVVLIYHKMDLGSNMTLVYELMKDLLRQRTDLTLAWEIIDELGDLTKTCGNGKELAKQLYSTFFDGSVLPDSQYPKVHVQMNDSTRMEVVKCFNVKLAIFCEIIGRCSTPDKCVGAAVDFFRSQLLNGNCGQVCVFARTPINVALSEYPLQSIEVAKRIMCNDLVRGILLLLAENKRHFLSLKRRASSDDGPARKTSK